MTIDRYPDWLKMENVVGPCIRPGGSLLTERALAVCDLPLGARIADIGCGTGGTLEYLEQTGLYRLVGLDLSEWFPKEAGLRTGSARLVQGRAEALPFRKNSFDGLFCECVLSVLDDPVIALGEYERVLKAGGFLIMSDLFRRSGLSTGPSMDTAQEFLMERPFTEQGILSVLAKHGFSVLLWEEHKRSLQEFVARMILAGERFSCSWWCGSGADMDKTDPSGISYFLLVARK